MRTTLKDRKKQFRGIYEELWDQPRIFIEDLGWDITSENAFVSMLLVAIVVTGILFAGGGAIGGIISNEITR
ncbi:MAG: hypothetical protein PVF58_18325 [Candidatus Methanofastidiosia archaeon]|jgi:hypothetical protein